MTDEKSKLSIVQSYATIAATVAVPILVAIFGYLIQLRISEESTKKDYVSMAISIINSKETPEDSDLRKWAVSVLDKNSPVPFGDSLRKSLSSGETVISKVYYPMPPPTLMEPPLPLKPLEQDMSKPVTLSDLLVNTVENYGIFHINAARLSSLQELIRSYSKIANDSSIEESSRSGVMPK